MKLYITSDISHMKRFHMKLQVNFTCERISYEIALQINYKWNFTSEKISNEITNSSKISHAKEFHTKLKVKFHMWKD